MAHRRVICDSEDEDGDYNSDFDSPAATDDRAAAPDIDNTTSIALTADGGEQRPPHDPNSDFRSTDPDFFRRIYEDQQNAAATCIPDTLRDAQPEIGSLSFSSAAASAVKKQKTSSSLTDPTLRNSLKQETKSKANIESRGFADMTQVTTPDAPVTKPKDIYDFDLSDEEGPVSVPSVAKSKFRATKSEATLTKVDSKRKRSTPKVLLEEDDAHSSPPRLLVRAQGSSANHPIELVDDDELPRPTRKKRKSGLQQAAREIPEDIDLLVIPTTADMNEPATEMNEGDENLGSVINDTFEARQDEGDRSSASAALVIVPPSLTASQKQQYLRVSGSSELDQETFGTDDQQQASLPAPKSQTQGLRSTNTESTIPYTTPSGYCSSGAPLIGLEAQSEHNVSDISSGKRSQLDILQPDCSPDELSAHPMATMSRVKKRKSLLEEEDELAQDDSWDFDKVGFSRDNYIPRPSKKRSRAVLEEEEDNVTAPEQLMPDTCPPGEMILGESEGARGVRIDAAQTTQSVDVEGLDPDFLAAMPDDIRQEIINNHRAAGNAQTARTRSRARPDEVSSGALLAREGTPQPKRRARKKKALTNDDTSLPAHETERQPSPAPVASAKKRRGRPRKSEPAPAPTNEENRPVENESVPQPETGDEPEMRDPPSIEDPQMTSQATKTTRKRGRKKKIAEDGPKHMQEDRVQSMRETENASETRQDDMDETWKQNPESPTEEFGEAAEMGRREALRDISNTVDHADPEVERDATPESKSKDSSKPAPSTSQLDKVRFRVGLSKRSRIAPLLKIIRK